jgi:hypothetical protein
VKYVSAAFQKHFSMGVGEAREKAALQAFEDALRGNNDLLGSIIEETSDVFGGDVSAAFRIYCLGKNVKNLLMWAHYADGHKGICIEFDTNNEVFSTAYRVEYVTEYPVWRLYDPKQTFFHLLTKVKDWEYEQEFRLIAQERQGTINQECLTANGNLLEISENAIRSIIVGCNAPFKDVQSIVRDSAPNIPLRKAKRIPNRYELEIG